MVRTNRKVLAVAAILGIAILLGGLFYFDHTVTIFDRPFFLSGEEQTIEAAYVSWGCNCANFIETKNFKHNPISEPQTNDYFFVEAAAVDLQLDSNFYLNRFKKIILTGQFYKDKGIPSEYELGHIEDKPQHARVFLYDKIEFLDN